MPIERAIAAWVRKYWFVAGLLAICLLTVLDRNRILFDAGSWLKRHHSADFVVASIFLLSGFVLSPRQLREGLTDTKGTLLAFGVIFIAAPLAAVLLSALPLEMGIVVGLFLVAVMPSTLSSGVVMTAAAGGSPAHALVITVGANALSVLTIPLALSVLLTARGLSASVAIDKEAVMLKIGLLVVLPLVAGMAVKHRLSAPLGRQERRISLINQFLVLFIVWVAMSQTRNILLASGSRVGLIVILSLVLHLILLLSAWGLIRLTGRGPGRRESVLFMGAQKTLPLSVVLQMSLFPEYATALLFCVLHHVVHLAVDGYLVQWLKRTA